MSSLSENAPSSPSTPILSARDKRLGLIAAVLVVVIWTGFIVTSRAGARKTLTPFDLAALRFIVGGLVMLPFFYQRKLWRMPWQQIAVVALLAGVWFTVLAFTGFSMAPAAHASVLLPGSLPFWTAIVALIVLKEKITGQRALGLGLIFLGILFVATSSMSDLGSGSSKSWRGDLMFLVASASWAVYTVYARRWQLDPISATAALAVYSALFFLPVYFLFLPSKIAVTPLAEVAFHGIYQGVFALALSMIAFTQVVKVYGPMRTTMITALVPGTSALAAIPFLGEPLSPWVLLGVLLTMLGMVLGVTKLFQNRH
jgi:drug/metabolite transporter (DMT)-like permease